MKKFIEGLFRGKAGEMRSNPNAKVSEEETLQRLTPENRAEISRQMEAAAENQYQAMKGIKVGSFDEYVVKRERGLDKAQGGTRIIGAMAKKYQVSPAYLERMFEGFLHQYFAQGGKVATDRVANDIEAADYDLREGDTRSYGGERRREEPTVAQPLTKNLPARQPPLVEAYDISQTDETLGHTVSSETEGSADADTFELSEEVVQKKANQLATLIAYTFRERGMTGAQYRQQRAAENDEDTGAKVFGTLVTTMDSLRASVDPELQLYLKNEKNYSQFISMLEARIEEVLAQTQVKELVPRALEEIMNKQAENLLAYFAQQGISRAEFMNEIDRWNMQQIAEYVNDDAHAVPVSRVLPQFMRHITNIVVAMGKLEAEEGFGHIDDGIIQPYFMQKILTRIE